MRAAACAAVLALLPAAAAAQDGVALGFPQLSGEVSMGLYSIGTVQASDRARRGSTTFLFGEIAAGLYLTERVSLQGVVHVEPVGEVEPDGTNTVFRYQAASLEALFAQWRAADGLTLFAGKFTAPFGYGHHAFPGILPMLRAHETYMVAESVGAGATWTFLSDPRLGEHDLTAAVFTFDTSPLSNTAITRKRCCEEGFERYRRNVLHQGGAGNNGNPTSVAVALDGDRIAGLPGFTYHLAALSRGEGKDGTAREWGWAAGARFEAAWSPTLRTLFFGEHVEFRNAGGRPLIETEGETEEPALSPLRETRRFSTLGAETRSGPWRATLAWQRDERARSIAPLATEHYVEASVGRDLFAGFGVDIGYQYARYAREDGDAGRAHALIGRLGFRRGF